MNTEVWRAVKKQRLEHRNLETGSGCQNSTLKSSFICSFEKNYVVLLWKMNALNAGNASDPKDCGYCHQIPSTMMNHYNENKTCHHSVSTEQQSNVSNLFPNTLINCLIKYEK